MRKCAIIAEHIPNGKGNIIWEGCGEVMRDLLAQDALSPDRTLTLTREHGRFFVWHHARDGSGWQHSSRGTRSGCSDLRAARHHEHDQSALLQRTEEGLRCIPRPIPGATK